MKKSEYKVGDLLKVTGIDGTVGYAIVLRLDESFPCYTVLVTWGNGESGTEEFWDGDFDEIEIISQLEEEL